MRKFLLMLGLVTSSLMAMAQQSEQPAQPEQKLVLTLEQALEIALSENPTIKVADQQIEIKRYAKKGTYASLYPQIDGTVTYQRVIQKQTMSMDMGTGEPMTIRVGSDNSFNGGVALGMAVVNAQLWESLKVSALDVELAVEQFKEIKIKLINDDNKSFQDYVIELIEKDMKGE